MLSKLSKTVRGVLRGKSWALGGVRGFRELSLPLRRCPRWVCVEDAVKIVNSEHLVFIQSGAATPLELVRALTEHGVCNNLRGVRLLHMALEGDAPFGNPEFEKHFRSISFYIGSNVRDAVNDGRADYIPVFNHEIPKLFYEGIISPDIAFIHVSPPDLRGFCSMGTSVDCTRAALCTAKIIVAQVNDHMPRSFGEAVIHSSHLDYAVKFDCPLPCISGTPPNELEMEIGKIVAQRLVEDGATVQLGLGNIPDAILCAMSNHKDIGVHTELLNEGMVDLVQKGVITNKFKNKHRGKSVASLGIGTKKLYDYIHNNPALEMLGIDYTNNPKIISEQPKMTAINSCIEMDITGQICSDSLGYKMYCGVGGQLDFLRGSSVGADGRGKSIVAFPSVTSCGDSKIQPALK
ncbi:uncharacterized protein [Fopius arisanus]|nr:PREDICTED: uncharacterized protein LOC105270323 isoform X2 [Fopius arisanus]